MAEKDNVSMTTVQLKPDYAASELYSTASEAPPAYKRQSNSVKVAKIAAYTIIASSVIIGSFILASSYLQARASCDEVQALDSVLEKQLVLETLQQVNRELPRADALIGRDTDDSDLQSLDKDDNETVKKEEQSPLASAPSSSDSAYSDSEESDDMQKLHHKVPLELDLSDLAAALLQNNQKSRMNCVVERKRIVEDVDTPARSVSLPFGVNLTTEPKKAKITGERIAIFCDSGDEDTKKENKKDATKDNEDEENDNGNDSNEDEAEAIRPMFIPFQRVPIPFGATPQQYPLTHMPQRMYPLQSQSFSFRPQQLPPPFQQLPIRPPMPPQFMQAPPQSEQQEQPHQPAHIRIQVQQLPIRELDASKEDLIHIIPHFSNNQDSQKQAQVIQIPSHFGNNQENHHAPQFQVQRLPLGLALQKAGITADDLRNIQRMAEERISEEIRRFAAEESSGSSESSENSSDEDDTPSNRVAFPQTQQLPLMSQQPPIPKDTMTPPMPDNEPGQPQILQIGRSAYGRSLLNPIRIPVPMMQAQADQSQDSQVVQVQDPERPHYVQPRSVRSVDALLKPEEPKRVKKCACDCNC